MTAEAHHYDDLHRLVDQLEPDQVEPVRAIVHMLVRPRTESVESGPGQRRRFSFANSISTEPDFAERSEEIIEEIADRYSE